MNRNGTAKHNTKVPATCTGRLQSGPRGISTCKSANYRALSEIMSSLASVRGNSSVNIPRYFQNRIGRLNSARVKARFGLYKTITSTTKTIVNLQLCIERDTLLFNGSPTNNYHSFTLEKLVIFIFLVSYSNTESCFHFA